MARPRFAVPHAQDARFERGLRSFFECRDLGIKDAPGGQVVAHVIRAASGAASAAAFGFLLTAAPTAHAETVLAAEVIRQSFAGNTAEFVGSANGLYVFWAADGAQRMHSPAAGPDTGAWRITPEGEFCGKWTRLRNGAEACAPVLDLGGGVYQWGNSKFRILLGNPKGL